MVRDNGLHPNTGGKGMSEHRPWFASYPEGVAHSLAPYPERSLYSILDESARRHPGAPAIAFWLPGAPMGKPLTYRDLLKQVEQSSGVLLSLGGQRGDRVRLLLPNCPQFVIAYYATLRIGAIVVGNNPLYTERELSHQLKDAGVEVCVTLDLLYPKLAQVQDEVGLREVVVGRVTDFMPFPINLLAPIRMRKEARKHGEPWPPVPAGAKVRWWKELMAGSYPRSPVAQVDARTDVAGLIYTGGTTGLSKGAMLTHHNLMANTMQGAAWFPDIRDGREGFMCIIPFFHSYGMTVGMNVGIYKAAKLVLMPRFGLGREGELAISGPQVMKGYFNRPEETAAMIKEDEDGTRWLLSGDIARMDDEGYFSIVDRKKEMIIVSGFKVFPTDIEQVIYRHPKVQKVCVAGVPDPTTGEAVKAYIVLREGQTATPEEIIEFSRSDDAGLSAYKIPKLVEFR